MSMDFSSLLKDPEFATAFTRHRTTVALDNEGRAEPSVADLELVGIVVPAQTADAELLPEGVRLTDVMAFFVPTEVRCGDGQTTVPDVLEWRGEKFTVLHLKDLGQYGVWKALAQRLVAVTPPPPVEGEGSGG